MIEVNVIWHRYLTKPKQLHDGKCENHYIMSIEVYPNDFDLTSNLTSAGKATFWTEVNKGIERFDKNEISLRPRKPQNLLPVAANSGKMLIRSIVHSSSSADDNHRKLPTPPPRHHHRSSSERHTSGHSNLSRSYHGYGNRDRRHHSRSSGDRQHHKHNDNSRQHLHHHKYWQFLPEAMYI